MRIGSRDVVITNRDKVFFPGLDLTKGDVVDYYLDLAPQILNHAARRPMLMKRYPNGVDGDHFFQKRIPVPHPVWMQTARVEFPSGRTADYPIVTNVASLAWIANLGCIDLNTWPTRVEHLERPDYLLIDLDPGPAHPFAHVRETALAVGEVMSDLGMTGYPKTSGLTGLHILAPIKPELEFPEVRRFAKGLAERVEQRVPGIATTTWRVADRDGVFIDFGQNARDHSAATAYSIRPTSDVRVSAPLSWHEVGDVDPSRFTLISMRERMARAGDPSAGMWRRKVSLLSRFERLELEPPDPTRRLDGAAARVGSHRAMMPADAAGRGDDSDGGAVRAPRAVPESLSDLPLAGDWRVGHFAAATPRIGSSLDVCSTTIVAHTEQVFTDGRWLFARDGALGAYEQLEPTLWGETDPRLRAHHSGEGELNFLWLMSRLGSVALREPAEVPLAQLLERVRDAVETLADWAKRAGASERAALTMVLTDGERLVAARRGTRLSWLERPSPKRAALFSSKPIGDGGWRPALDGMILAAGADARLV